MKTTHRHSLTIVAIVAALAISQTNGARGSEAVYDKVVRSTTLILSPVGRGTGVLVDAERKLIATNYHVVQGQSFADVVFPLFENGVVVSDPKTYTEKYGSVRVTGKVISSDPKRDLALIEVDHIPDGSVPIEFANDPPRPGAAVHSIGNPGASHVLWVYTFGRVRQVYKTKITVNRGWTCEMKVIETQAPTNPGDSGGPVVNDEGKLVGITQSYSGTSRMYSYAVELEEIKSLLNGENSSVDSRLASIMSHLAVRSTVTPTGSYELKLPTKTTRQISVYVESNTIKLEKGEFRRIASPLRVYGPKTTSDKITKLVNDAGKQAQFGQWRVIHEEKRDVILFEVYFDSESNQKLTEDVLGYVANQVLAANKAVELAEAQQSFENLWNSFREMAAVQKVFEWFKSYRLIEA